MTSTQKRPNPFPGGLLVLSPKGTIIEAPQFFIDSLALTEHDAPSIYHLFDDTRASFLAFERVLRRQNGIYEFYVSVIDSSDRPRGFRYWSVSPNQANRRNTPITFYIVDESTLLQSQEWKRRRLRRDILNHVRISLSQYIKTRLTSIQLLAEVLRDNPTRAKETGERLLDAVDELLASLDDMISPQMIASADELPLIALNQLGEVISSWSETKRVVAKHHGVESKSMMPTEYLERIVAPLVQNAVEAINEDESVEVDIWELNNGYARIDINDKGDGMSEYVRQHAEDPFFTTKAGHLGLGLSQAYEALQSVGGQWRIESKNREGTRITLLLPLEEPWPDDDGVQAAAAEAAAEVLSGLEDMLSAAEEL